tara:strand:- start:179 stop:754 length:576 start_codon:yes stop_codon:yes gene_type:complete
MELISFKSWMKKSISEQRELQQIDFSSWEYVREDVAPKNKKQLMGKLSKLLSKHDWWYAMSDSGVDYRKGRKEDDEINALMRKIGGDEPKQLYRKFARRAGTMEGKNVLEYMEDEYQNMGKKRTNENVDSSPSRKTDDYMNPRNWFPDMDRVTATGSLNEVRPVGEKGKSYFSDGGNLNYNTDKWIPPNVK